MSEKTTVTPQLGITAEEQWQHDDLTRTIQLVMDDHGNADDIAMAVENWCLDDRFSSREKWLRFIAHNRKEMKKEDTPMTEKTTVTPKLEITAEMCRQNAMVCANALQETETPDEGASLATIGTMWAMIGQLCCVMADHDARNYSFNVTGTIRCPIIRASGGQ